MSSVNTFTGPGIGVAHRRDAENAEKIVINGLTEKIIRAAIRFISPSDLGFSNRLTRNV